MNAAPSTLATTAPRPNDRRQERRFFTGMAIIFVLVAFVGFAPTYYLGRFYGAPKLEALVHVHAVIASSWCILFLVQATLIATHRVRIHRRVGVAGAILAIALIVSGYLVAVNSARLGHGPPGRNHVQFLAIPLMSLLLFGGFVGLGLLKRKNRELHKRLMVLATIALLSAALARIGRHVGVPGPLALLVGTIVLVSVALAWDWLATGRLHPVLLWGGLICIASQPARDYISHTPAWMTVADRLMGSG